MKTKLQSTIERVVTYGVTLFCVLVLVYFFGSTNKRQKADGERKTAELVSLDKQIVQAESELERRKQQVAEIELEYEQKRDEINEKFEKQLEKQDSYTVFIEQVQRKAKALDILIQNSTYETPSKASNSKYYEFRFNATISGQYGKLKKFLWEVENAMGRLVKVDSIEIIAPITDKQGNMNFKISVSTFFLPEH